MSIWDYMCPRLFNKVGEILLLLLGVLCNLMLDTYPFTQLGIPSEVAYAVAVYISSMEVLSILENICKIAATTIILNNCSKGLSLKPLMQNPHIKIIIITVNLPPKPVVAS